MHGLKQPLGTIWAKTKSVESAVWCLLTLDYDVEQVVPSQQVTGTSRTMGSKYLNRVQVQNCSFSFEQQSKQNSNENETK